MQGPSPWRAWLAMIAQQVRTAAPTWRYDPLAVLSERDRARLEGRREGRASSLGFDPERGSFVSSNIPAENKAGEPSPALVSVCVYFSLPVATLCLRAYLPLFPTALWCA